MGGHYQSSNFSGGNSGFWKILYDYVSGNQKFQRFSNLVDDMHEEKDNKLFKRILESSNANSQMKQSILNKLANSSKQSPTD